MPADVPPRSARDLVVVLYRQAGLVAICLLVGSAAGALLYAKQPRLYASSAKVWVQTGQPDAPSRLAGVPAYRDAPYPAPIDRKIDTEIELMLTRTSAQAVVDRLHIRDEQLVRGGLAGIRADLAAMARGGGRGRARTVDLVLDGLAVVPLRSKTADAASEVLEVTFECADATLAPAALQAFLDNYLQLGAQQHRRLGETTARAVAGQVEQAKEELRQIEEGIVALLVQDGGRRPAAGAASGVADVPASGRLRLDPNPGAATAAAPAATALEAHAHAHALQLRLDEARQFRADEAASMREAHPWPAGSPQRLAGPLRENTRLEAELNRLERQRRLVQERCIQLQNKLDQVELYLRLTPAEAESRVVIDAPDHPGPGDGRKKLGVAILGPLAGLLAGLFLAGLRELGGDRMRSPRAAEWALGVPVLGAIPTLSAKARASYLVAPVPASLDDVAEAGAQ